MHRSDKARYGTCNCTDCEKIKKFARDWRVSQWSFGVQPASNFLQVTPDRFDEVLTAFWNLLKRETNHMWRR